MKQRSYIKVAILIAIIIAATVIGVLLSQNLPLTSSSKGLQVVAAENFWGSLYHNLAEPASKLRVL